MVHDVGADLLDDVMALFAHAWWTRDRAREQVAAMLANTPVRVALRSRRHGRLVGFARAISDGVYKALVMDVIVDEALRGHRIGHRLVQELLAHPAGAGVDSVGLYCHPNRERFYSDLGFAVAVVGGGAGAGTVQTLMRRGPAPTP